MRSVKIFFAVFVLHQILQGYFWSAHPGNTPPGKGVLFAKYGWDILSFPIEFLPASLSETLGIFTLLFNSLLWAGSITLLLNELRNKNK